MPLKTIPLSELQKIGTDLNRPEDVVVGRDGRVWVSDQAAAVALIGPNNIVKRVGKAGGAVNGINMDREGRIVMANYALGTGDPGPLQRLDPATGTIEVLCSHVEGKALTSSNYPIIANNGDIYCTHSTWATTTEEAFDPARADGFVFRVDKSGKAKIVAQGLKFANGCCLDWRDTHLYVAQTTGGNVLRFEILADGALGQGVPYGPSLGYIPSTVPFGVRLSPRERSRLGYVDGIGFDQEGNLWATLFLSNRIVAITPNLKVHVIIDDPEGKVLRFPTNISWGGSDLCDLYIGTLAGGHVFKTRSPVPGMPLVHQR